MKTHEECQADNRIPRHAVPGHPGVFVIDETHIRPSDDGEVLYLDGPVMYARVDPRDGPVPLVADSLTIELVPGACGPVGVAS